MGGLVGDLEGSLVEGPHRAWREGRVDLEALDNPPGPVLAQGKEVLPTSRLKNEKFRFQISSLWRRYGGAGGLCRR